MNNNSLNYLQPLLEKKGKVKDVYKLYERVNIIFHDIEAKYYDYLHSDMLNSLQIVYDSIISEILKDSSTLNNIRVLDIGCGTGLSSKMLLDTDLGKQISKITLLDTSSKMLEKAKDKIKKYPIEINTFHGRLEEINAHNNYDLILVSSVLHHIPDLDNFIHNIDKLLSINGFFLHIHDPNGDYIKDEKYLENIKEYREYRSTYKPNILTKIKNRIFRFFKPPIPDYILEVNEELIKKNIIHVPFTPDEIWSITDIHVEDLPYSTNDGISLNWLKTKLTNYKLITARGYCFYGELYSELLPFYKLKELQLFKNKEINGRNLCGIWKKTS